MLRIKSLFAVVMMIAVIILTYKIFFTRTLLTLPTYFQKKQLRPRSRLISLAPQPSLSPQPPPPPTYRLRASLDTVKAEQQRPAGVWRGTFGETKRAGGCSVRQQRQRGALPVCCARVLPCAQQAFLHSLQHAPSYTSQPSRDEEVLRPGVGGSQTRAV